MSRPVRRIALYGYLGSGNLGNDASLETVLSWLRATDPSLRLSCITIAPEEVRARYGIPAVALASGTRSAEGVSPLRKVLGRVRDVPRSLRLAGSTDAVVVPGMGVLEDTLGSHPWGLPLWLFLVAGACRLRRRRFLLLDVGADEAQSPVTRWLYVATARLATHVSYRDVESAAVMARAGAGTPDAVAPDLAFAHPASTVAEPEPGRVVVGVMAYYGPQDDPVAGAGVRRRYVATLAGAVTDLVDSGRQVVLVGGDRVDADVAREVLAEVRAARPGLPADRVRVRDLRTFPELTEEMRRAEVVVASRFHNLICALRLGRPTVSVGYAGKSRHLMDAMGLQGYSQDIEQLDRAVLVAQVESAAADGPDLADRIGSRSADYAAQVRALLDQVALEELGLPPQGGDLTAPTPGEKRSGWHSD